MLESSVERFALLDSLRAYATAAPDRMVSFFNFLVTSRFRDDLRYSAWLIEKRDELLDTLVARLSSDAEASKPPQTDGVQSSS